MYSGSAVEWLLRGLTGIARREVTMFLEEHSKKSVTDILILAFLDQRFNPDIPRYHCNVTFTLLEAGPASLLGVLTTIQAELAPFGSLHDLLHKVNAFTLAPRILIMPEDEVYLSRLAEPLSERGAGKQAWEACPLPLISGLAHWRVMLSLMDALLGNKQSCILYGEKQKNQLCCVLHRIHHSSPSCHFGVQKTDIQNAQVY
jgi:hypothetical protein